MKKLYLNTGDFDTIFNDLKDSFKGELSASNNEYNLIVKSKWANGKITGIRFEKEVSYMHFDLVFNNDITLSMESFKSAPVFFAYCENGSVGHSFGANGERKNIKTKQAGILHNTSAINSVLYFESHKHIQFSLIGMPTTELATNQNAELIAKVKKRFTNESGNFVYVGHENARITQKLQEFKTIPQTGIVKNLLQRSILNSVLELEIAQHSSNYSKAFEPILNLANRQITELKRISHINIGEVLNAAGLASRNYLPRIFKEKYHLSYKPYNQKLAS
jgi:hypothetical protein